MDVESVLCAGDGVLGPRMGTGTEGLLQEAVIVADMGRLLGLLS